MYNQVLPFSPKMDFHTSPVGDETEHVGKICVTPDTVYFRGWVILVVCRNASGIALEPKRMVTFKSGSFMREVDGYSRTTGAKGRPIWDQHNHNIAINDLLYAVLEGPTLVKTGLVGGGGELVIAEGDWVIAATAATSQATTAGRVQVQNIANATTDNDLSVLTYARNAIGQALTARTTNNTDTDTLVLVGPRF